MSHKIRIEDEYIAVFDEENRDIVIQISRARSFKGIPLNRLSQAVDSLLDNPFEWFEQHPIKND